MEREVTARSKMRHMFERVKEKWVGGGGSVQDKQIMVFNDGEQKSSCSVGSGTAPEAVVAIKVAA